MFAFLYVIHPPLLLPPSHSFVTVPYFCMYKILCAIRWFDWILSAFCYGHLLYRSATRIGTVLRTIPHPLTSAPPQHRVGFFSTYIPNWTAFQSHLEKLQGFKYIETEFAPSRYHPHDISNSNSFRILIVLFIYLLPCSGITKREGNILSSDSEYQLTDIKKHLHQNQGPYQLVHSPYANEDDPIMLCWSSQYV